MRVIRARAVTAAAVVAIALSALIPTAGLAARHGATPATSPAAAAACVRGAKACPIRIVFRPGAYSGQASSRLSGQGQERWFSVRAAAGQTMVVVVAGRGPTGGTVYFPGGGQDGGPGGRIYDGEVPRSGLYRVRVTESLMGEAWSGPVTVVVMVY